MWNFDPRILRIFRLCLCALAILFTYVMYKFAGFHKNTRILQPSDLLQFQGIQVYPYTQNEYRTVWSSAQLEDFYFAMIEKKYAVCSNQRREICVGGPYEPRSPCLGYSFEVFLEDELEQKVSDYNCTVRVFNVEPNKLGSNFQPFSAIHQKLKKEEHVIDVLKLELDFPEWTVLEGILSDGSLKNVKQLLIESRVTQMKLKTVKKRDILNLIRVYQKLEELGFRRWRYQNNSQKQFLSLNSNKMRSCCYKHNYINVNFLRNGVKTRNYAFIQLPYKSLRVRYNWSANLAEYHYHVMMQTNHGECPFVRRIGREGDGGWDVCFTDDIKPVKPCLVYSFGVNYIWEFDDQMSGELGCEVLAFDPSMMLAMTHRRRSTLMFYKEGLAGTDGFSERGYKLNKLSSLLKRFQHENRTIDILKMDIEHWEWSSLSAALNDGSLRNVRQFMFETHTSGPRTSAATHVHFMRIWQGLYKLGFRQWQYHNNPYGAYRSEFTGDVRACCHEHYLVNINMLTKSVL